MVAKRHHYLPQCYLKAFSKPKKRGRVQAIQVYDRAGKTFNTNIINIATEKDFNRVNIEGQPQDVFEQGVAKFEAELAPALTRIIESKSLKDEKDKHLLLNFIAAASVRVPRQREQLRDFHEQIAYAILELAIATPERWEGQKKQMAEKGIVLGNDVPYEELRKSILDRTFRLELANEWQIDLEMTGMDAILPTLMNRKWKILVAPQDSPGFVTSDYPVALMFSDPAMRGGFYGPGHGMPGTEVVFPVSNRLALVGTFEGKDESINVDADTVASVNGALVAYCDRQVYAPSPDFTYSRQNNEQPRQGASVLNDIHFLSDKKKK